MVFSRVCGRAVAATYHDKFTRSMRVSLVVQKI